MITWDSFERQTPHLVVRGGVDGTFEHYGQADGKRGESAFFGEGMTKYFLYGCRPTLRHPPVDPHDFWP